ncbi:MAG TPA: hypothetical protein PLD03_10575 [Thiomonas arsenitoxydans]|jgi:hypothetical protein|uniref:Uncharacterized protein n=1 Tax=Thiomonas intermedia (strain K12) TaxID=75379 RepID=D5X3W8_THIK1|nr:hypothetical protein [Thiomonas sp.]OZB76270.1 MAG: hypothetical protein B7X36_04165 [Thiomonas sp. 14-64-326]HOI67038.1 hypothetical protein [Thiomonas arsenitoxydans]
MLQANPPSADAAPPSLFLADHAIHGLFHLDLDSGRIEGVDKALHMRAEQARAMRAGDLPARIHLPNPQAQSQQSLWEAPSGKGMALDDFYPYARQILGAKAEQTTVCVSLTLSSEGKQALTQVKGGKPRHWRLRLGKAAQERCGRDLIDLQFDKARLYLFRTGVVILDLRWRYVQDGDVLPASVVLEGNYLLSHGNLQGKTPTASDGDPEPLDAHRLLEIAQALLPEEWTEQAPLQPGRRLLYSLARTQGSASEEAILELGIRLSHRQTSDYRPKPQPLESSVLQPFPYLCHVLAPEGTASVIATDPTASDFANNFVCGTGANTYVPLFVSSLHNHLWLLGQTEWLPAQRHGDKRHEVHDLEEVYERTVEFRRYFYFPMISQISLHNAFYERSQQVFKIAERQRFLEQTTHDIAELLKARRTKWIGRISGAVAGFLVSHELLDIVSQSGLPGSMPNLRVWLVETAHASPTVIESLVRLVERWDLIVFFGSLAGALLGYWAAWYFDKSPKAE